MPKASVFVYGCDIGPFKPFTSDLRVTARVVAPQGSAALALRAWFFYYYYFFFINVPHSGETSASHLFPVCFNSQY